jgi:hypothetical protein
MLFTSMILLTLGYTMVYSALHGNWQFWQYFFPGAAPANDGLLGETAA